MSERGSFVSEFIYCKKCVAAIRFHFDTLTQTKYWQANQLWSIYGGETELLPIFAGKIGGIYIGEELVVFEEEIVPALEEVVCHTVRFVVIPDDGRVTTFLINPMREEAA